ncbi:MAG TPA: ATP phosphoribosyltransferase [Synergistetes bacterium]|nr:ATP phosphoribosyltransferase [Synergistota bacterium]
MISIAVPTGRMLKESIPVLSRMGLPCESLFSPGRSLVIEEKDFKYLLAKPMDVPSYVHYGAADMALSGSDVLMERSVPLVELAETGAGRCRLVVAGSKELAPRFSGAGTSLTGLRVATKYPGITASFFASRGARLEIIHMHGSVELAPLLGISDCILDIVQSGETLRANGLRVLLEVANVSMRLLGSRYFIQKNRNFVSGIISMLEPRKGRIFYGDQD